MPILVKGNAAMGKKGIGIKMVTKIAIDVADEHGISLVPVGIGEPIFLGWIIVEMPHLPK